jgi:DNA-binding transcriptional LysR family regulator
MHISQPALSRLISSLEADLGYPLFRRVGGRVVPTAEAEMLREEIQNALGSVDRATHRAMRLGSLDHGSLAICAFPSLAATALPRLLSSFCDVHPHVSVALNAMHWHRLLDEVAMQRADFAISDLPAHANGVVAEHLCRYQAVCVVQAGHPFSRETVVPVTAIARERFISLGEEDEAGATVQNAFKAAGIDLVWKSEVSLCASACAWVAAAGGCAIVDPFAAEAWTGTLVQVATKPAIWFDLWILKSNVRPLTRLATAFLDVVRGYVSALPGVGSVANPTRRRRAKKHDPG